MPSCGQIPSSSAALLGWGVNSIDMRQCHRGKTILTAHLCPGVPPNMTWKEKATAGACGTPQLQTGGVVAFPSTLKECLCC